MPFHKDQPSNNIAKPEVKLLLNNGVLTAELKIPILINSEVSTPL